MKFKNKIQDNTFLHEVKIQFYIGLQLVSGDI